MNSSLKFPDLTEAKELETLEYSHNKDEIDLAKLEKEGLKLFESFQSKDKTLEKYLPKSEEGLDQEINHAKKESIFTLSNNEYPKSKGEQTAYDSTVMHSRPGSFIFNN